MTDSTHAEGEMTITISRAEELGGTTAMVETHNFDDLAPAIATVTAVFHQMLTENALSNIKEGLIELPEEIQSLGPGQQEDAVKMAAAEKLSDIIAYALASAIDPDGEHVYTASINL